MFRSVSPIHSMTAARPKLSVILPVYNSEKYLRDSIASILEQSFTDFELLVIDDGSVDTSATIIETFSVDPRLKVIKNSQNLGLSASLNKGLRHAQGKYIARMDADDIALPHRLKVQFDFLESHPDIYLIGSQARALSADGKQLQLISVPCEEQKVTESLPKAVVIIHPTICFRHSGEFFYREKMDGAEDYDLYLRMITAEKRMLNLPIVLLWYRIHGESISFTRQREQLLLISKGQEFYFQRKTQGHDGYEGFNAENLTKSAKSFHSNAFFLAAEIRKACKTNNRPQLKLLTKCYFQQFGFGNRYILYYLSTFVPFICIRFWRKLVWGGKDFFLEARQKRREKHFYAALS